jgi:hypothetical protein
MPFSYSSYPTSIQGLIGAVVGAASKMGFHGRAKVTREGEGRARRERIGAPEGPRRDVAGSLVGVDGSVVDVDGWIIDVEGFVDGARASNGVLTRSVGAARSSVLEVEEVRPRAR